MPTLRELFANPPNSYRLQPFWFLNHELDEDELRRQIRQMHAQGVGGVVLHARHGLLTPWMSDQWLDAMAVCLDELKALGMEAWLYDEDNWPSGTCGGRLTREHPEYRARYLRVQNLRVNGGVTYQVRLPDYGNSLICIQAVRISAQSAQADGHLQFVGEPRDLTEHYQQGRLRWEAPPGKWFVAVFWDCPVHEKATFGDGYYLDTMNEEAVRAFRSRAYEPYERLKDEFGDTIKGIFTDEPQVMAPDAYKFTAAAYPTTEEPLRKLPGVTLAWTRDMLDKFRQLKGYDLRPRLMQLLWDIGEGTQKVRNDYYNAIATWYCDNYHGQLAEWCREHGIEYIGHTIEDPFWRQIRTQGDQMAVLARFDRPGFDYLGHGFLPQRLVAAKSAISAAHLDGRQRITCEAFGGSGHQATLAEQRADLNFICIMGCNTVIPHALYYSMAGHRKTDFPPTHFYHNGYWLWYRGFADYAARQCLVQAVGRHVGDALVLVPTETAQVDSWQEGEFHQEPPCERLLTWVSDELLRLHCDYDYVSDSRLQAAVIRQDKLTFPTSEEGYGLLIMPGCRVMSVQTARKLVEWQRAGGSLIILGEPPSQALERDQDQALQELVAELLEAATAVASTDREDGRGGTHEAQGADRQVDSGDEESPDATGDEADTAERTTADESDGKAAGFQYPPAAGRVVYHPGNGLDVKWLQNTLSDLLQPDFILHADDPADHRDTICSRRREGSLELFMLHNRSERRQAATATVALAGALEEWDLETGDTVAADAEYTSEQTQWHVDLEPAETRLFVLDGSARGETARVEGTVRPQVLAEIDLGPRWHFDAAGQNVAILDRWQVVLDDRAAEARLDLHGVGQANSYVTSFEIEGRIGQVRLVLDELPQRIPAHIGFGNGRRTLEVFVNGLTAPPLEPSEWQDHYFATTDISDLLQPGSNELHICTLSLLEPMKALCYPAWLVGQFANFGGRLLPEPEEIEGYFSHSGYPHLPDIGVYSKHVEIPQELLDGNKRLILDVGQVRDCARTLVNGREVAVRLWEPFEVDITDELQPGDNHIVVEVAGTLANLYDKATHPAGLPGPAKLWVIG